MMMKKIVLFIVPVLLVSGCSKNDNGEEFTKLSIERNELSFGAAGDPLESPLLIIHTSLDWMIVPEEGTVDWVGFSETQGTGDSQVRLTVSSWPVGFRKAVFHVSSGEQRDTLTVYQNLQDAFKDQKFRDYCLRRFDIDSDGVLSITEVLNAKMIDVTFFTLYSLAGIELFSGLSVLNCGINNLTELDLSHNTKLTQLQCPSNRLEALDLSACTELKFLECSNNQLEELDLSHNRRLNYVTCAGNELNALDVSQNEELTVLYLGENSLTRLDLSGNPALEMLDVNANAITELDISGNKALTSVNCSANRLTVLTCGNPELLELFCHDNQLKQLDISHNKELRTLECYNNPALSAITVWSGFDMAHPNNSIWRIVKDDSTQFTEP